MPNHLDLCSKASAELPWLDLLDREWVEAEFDAIVAAEWPNKPPRLPKTRPHRSPWRPRWTPSVPCSPAVRGWSTRLDPRVPRQRSPPGI